MKRLDIKKTLLDERIMRNVSILSLILGLASFVTVFLYHDLSLQNAFERVVKLLLAILTLWSFSRCHWDVTKGIMGGLLFALLYRESNLVLGRLWGETSDFDSYLIMGVQGSLYLAVQTMSFMMTIIIIINHFVIGYSNKGNWGSVVLNQISIIFKITLYVFLMVINGLLSMPLYQQIANGLEYAADLNIIIMLICVETQLDNFKSIKHELAMDKKKKGASHE